MKNPRNRASRTTTPDPFAYHVGYEWVVEELEADGDDIREVWHSDGYAEARARAEGLRAEGKRVEVALQRLRGSEADGLDDRQYAYLEDGKLPACFGGGAKVPQRFHASVAMQEFKAQEFKALQRVRPLCVHCGEPRTRHGRFARCSGDATQFESKERIS